MNLHYFYDADDDDRMVLRCITPNEERASNLAESLMAEYPAIGSPDVHFIFATMRYQRVKAMRFRRYMLRNGTDAMRMELFARFLRLRFGLSLREINKVTDPFVYAAHGPWGVRYVRIQNLDLVEVEATQLPTPRRLDQIPLFNLSPAAVVAQAGVTPAVLRRVETSENIASMARSTMEESVGDNNNNIDTE